MIEKINPTKSKEYSNHEAVYRFEDKDSGLKGFLALHSTKLGPAVGGTRYFPYENEGKALEDVLRLSKSMSYKCVLAEVPYGGGKCVLIAPSHNAPKSKKYLEAYADVLKNYSDKFFTGEDVGMNLADIEELGKITSNIIGTEAKAGDPSPWAALSTFYAVRGALKFYFGDSSFKGKKILIKGVGKVGTELVRLCHEAGAIITISDIDKERIKKIVEIFSGVSVVSPEEFADIDCDIFAPCALDRDITTDVAKKIKAKIICGAANNQLDNEDTGTILLDRGIVYVPDYIANGGGLINVVSELSERGYNRDLVVQKCKKIEDEVFSILTQSKEANIAPNIIANRIVKQKLYN